MEAKKKKALIAALISRQLLLNTLMISKILENDNYNDDDELLRQIGAIAQLLPRIRGERLTSNRMRGFVERIVPQFNAKQFQEHFRLTPAAFENLENLVGARLSAISKTPVRKQLLAIIWLLATPDSYR